MPFGIDPKQVQQVVDDVTVIKNTQVADHAALVRIEGKVDQILQALAKPSDPAK